VIEGILPAGAAPASPIRAADVRDCALADRTVLVVAAGNEAWHSLAGRLDGLGLRLRSCEFLERTLLAPGEIVDMVVIDAGLDADAAFAAIDALVEERPWVPVVACIADGMAVRILSDGRRAVSLPEAIVPLPLRCMIARTLCRAARHRRSCPDCQAALRA
jgi:hypothetical protein